MKVPNNINNNNSNNLNSLNNMYLPSQIPNQFYNNTNTNANTSNNNNQPPLNNMFYYQQQLQNNIQQQHQFQFQNPSTYQNPHSHYNNNYNSHSNNILPLNNNNNINIMANNNLSFNNNLNNINNQNSFNQNNSNFNHNMSNINANIVANPNFNPQQLDLNENTQLAFALNNIISLLEVMVKSSSPNKDVISGINQLADEYKQYKHHISKLIINTYKNAKNVIQQLNLLYVIDSLVKNIEGFPYNPLFSKYIENMYCQVFKDADYETKKKLFKLYYTWRFYLSDDVLDSINQRFSLDFFEQSLEKEDPDMISRYRKYREDTTIKFGFNRRDREKRERNRDGERDGDGNREKDLRRDVNTTNNNLIASSKTTGSREVSKEAKSTDNRETNVISNIIPNNVVCSGFHMNNTIGSNGVAKNDGNFDTQVSNGMNDCTSQNNLVSLNNNMNFSLSDVNNISNITIMSHNTSIPNINTLNSKQNNNNTEVSKSNDNNHTFLKHKREMDDNRSVKSQKSKQSITQNSTNISKINERLINQITNSNYNNINNNVTKVPAYNDLNNNDIDEEEEGKFSKTPSPERNNNSSNNNNLLSKKEFIINDNPIESLIKKTKSEANEVLFKKKKTVPSKEAFVANPPIMLDTSSNFNELFNSNSGNQISHAKNNISSINNKYNTNSNMRNSNYINNSNFHLSNKLPNIPNSSRIHNNMNSINPNNSINNFPMNSMGRPILQNFLLNNSNNRNNMSINPIQGMMSNLPLNNMRTNIQGMSNIHSNINNLNTLPNMTISSINSNLNNNMNLNNMNTLSSVPNSINNINNIPNYPMNNFNHSNNNLVNMNSNQMNNINPNTNINSFNNNNNMPKTPVSIIQNFIFQLSYDSNITSNSNNIYNSNNQKIKVPIDTTSYFFSALSSFLIKLIKKTEPIYELKLVKEITSNSDIMRVKSFSENSNLNKFFKKVCYEIFETSKYKCSSCGFSSKSHELFWDHKYLHYYENRIKRTNKKKDSRKPGLNKTKWLTNVHSKDLKDKIKSFHFNFNGNTNNNSSNYANYSSLNNNQTTINNSSINTQACNYANMSLSLINGTTNTNTMVNYNNIVYASTSETAYYYLKKKLNLETEDVIAKVDDNFHDQNEENEENIYPVYRNEGYNNSSDEVNTATKNYERANLQCAYCNNIFDVKYFFKYDFWFYIDIVKANNNSQIYFTEEFLKYNNLNINKLFVHINCLDKFMLVNQEFKISNKKESISNDFLSMINGEVKFNLNDLYNNDSNSSIVNNDTSN